MHYIEVTDINDGNYILLDITGLSVSTNNSGNTILFRTDNDQVIIKVKESYSEVKEKLLKLTNPFIEVVTTEGRKVSIRKDTIEAYDDNLNNPGGSTCLHIADINVDLIAKEHYKQISTLLRGE